MNKSIGFTLIELIIVVTILGILAALAIPHYIDLSGDSNTATTNSVAAALSAANAVNYTSRKASAAKGIAIANCTDMANALQNGVPSGYTITAAAITVGTTASCTLTGPKGNTAVFNATGIT